MANNFREKQPVRTCKKNYARYGSYKPFLEKDFLKRCGYTDSPDFWFGGVNNFHIDHFIPWKNYPLRPQLKTDYQNLVYCCSYVNILKSNDETGYLDPCNVDFNLHFTRDDSGKIIPVAASKEANYMYKKFKLFMKRYQIIWMLDKIFDKMEKLQNVIESTPNGEYKNGLLITQGELAGFAVSYRKYLSGNQ